MNACYPGSFDPISLGHLDIIKRISKLYDNVYILISNNIKKKYLFSAELRKDMIKKSIKGINNIKVIIYDGLVTDFCLKNNIDIIIRGLRNINDYENEYTLALFNKDLAPDVETLLLFPTNNMQIVSSSAIKELLYYNADIKKYVPLEIIDIIKDNLKK